MRKKVLAFLLSASVIASNVGSMNASVYGAAIEQDTGVQTGIDIGKEMKAEGKETAAGSGISLKAGEITDTSAELFFGKVANGTDETEYTIYRAEGEGEFAELATVTPNTEGITSTKVKNPALDECFYEDFEGKTIDTSLFGKKTGSTREIFVGQDTSLLNNNQTTIIGTPPATGDINICNKNSFGITENITVDLDFKMDATKYNNKTNFALLQGNSSSNWLASSTKILTITGFSDKTPGTFKTVEINEMSDQAGDTGINSIDITEKARITDSDYSYVGSLSGWKKSGHTTGWMHLTAGIDFSNKKVYLTLSHIKNNEDGTVSVSDVIYDYKTAGNNEGLPFKNAAATQLDTIFLCANKEAGGVYLDNVSIVKGLPSDIEAAGGKEVINYIYKDTTVQSGKTYKYKITSGDITSDELSVAVEKNTITGCTVDDITMIDTLDWASQAPETVMAEFKRGPAKEVAVTWDFSNLAKAEATMEGAEVEITGSCEEDPAYIIKAKVILKKNAIKELADIYLEFDQNTGDTELRNALPKTVKATYLDGSIKDAEISWPETIDVSEVTGTDTFKPVAYTVPNTEGTFEGSANISVVKPLMKRFDFGITTSKTGEGWIGIAVDRNGTKTIEELDIHYTAEKGYGFEADASTKFGGREEAFVCNKGVLTQPVYQDFALCANQPFRIDVPNGSYEVTMVTGTGIGSTTLVGTINDVSYSTVKATKENYTQKSVTVEVTDNKIVYVSTDANTRLNALIIRAISDGIEIEPFALSLPKSLVLATGSEKTLEPVLYPKNANKNADITWESSDDAIAAVDTNGKITAAAKGTATITAKTANNITASCEITVGTTVESIIITDGTDEITEKTIQKGKTFELKASVLPENADDNTVIWSTDNEAVATVNPQTGVVTGVSAGTAVITATANDGSGVTGICTITVREPVLVTGIRLDPKILTFDTAETKKITAFISPDEADNKELTWTSSDKTVATVDEEGNVTAVKTGETTITATAKDGSGKKDTCAVKVEITGEPEEIPVTGVTITPDKAAIETGKTKQLTATVQPANATDQSVTWSSNDENKATVDQTGLVTAKAVGTVTITATTANGKTASATITITEAGTVIEATGIVVTPDKATIEEGKTKQLTAKIQPENATDKTIIWKSNKTEIADVDSSGLVTAKAAGTAIITATTANGKTASAEISVIAAGTAVEVTGITVTPDKATIETGKTQQLIAKLEPENATDQTVTWASDQTEIADVDSNGLVTAKAAGTATITATTANGKTAQASITVTEAGGDTVPVESITLDKTEATLTAAGQTVTLTATVLPEKADQTVTWTSSDPTKATVENGVVTAVANGTATITAAAVNGMHAAALVTVAIGDSGNVTDTKVSAITVTAADNKTTLTKAGETVQLTAAVLPAEAKDKSVTWASSNPAAAAVSETGLVTAVANGTATISATAKDGSNVKGDLTITVNIPAPEETVGGAVGSSVKPADAKEKGSYKVTVQGTVGKAAEVAFTGTKETGKKIIIPNTVKGTDGVTYQVTKITKSAISANQKKKITEVKIPDNVKTIEAGAFTNCTKLTKVTFTKKSKLTKIDANTFKGCKEIKTFTIPGSVTKIGKSAFEKCTALKKIVIPDKVTEIGDKAFSGNKKMTDVTIGKKVTKIGKQAFYGCKLLKKVKVNTTKLKTVGKNAFKGVKKGAQAKVPAKQKKAYKNLLKPLKVK